MTSPHVLALIVAAGSGSRAGGDLPKQYQPLGGIPVLRRTVLAFLNHPRIDRVRVVIRFEDLDRYASAVDGLSIDEPIIGGDTRQASVHRGLEGVMSEIADEDRHVTVLIHDAARPFVSAALIDRCLDKADAQRSAGADVAVVPALPVVDSLRRGTDRLTAEIDRKSLLRVQTPQGFDLGRILEIHRKWARDAGRFTDDSAMAMSEGLSVETVAGDEANLKLTTMDDFARAEAMLASRLQPRTGIGFDVHAFGAGDHVWLGGIRIGHERGLAGHSDADVALHALTDALLGAIGAGDIGDHFPPGDPRWRGAPSSLFLDHARGLIDRIGGRIVHCDLTLICEAPRIGPYRDPMRARIADLLQLPLSRVSVKATTTERLGFTGRGEGIAAQAIATVLVPESA
ncbi:MAG: bifunctional 2-C-methyl-D-erythritol 4-phosphate cytidylyltransferase/2-C-methyl-D-erythritol 2,4-cyclodiphosphate synthase [Sphingomonas sp.]